MNCPDCLMERSEIVELLGNVGWSCPKCGYLCVGKTKGNSMIAQKDPELFDWLRRAAGHSFFPAEEDPGAAGDFLRNLAEAGLRADWENYPILRPVLLQMKAKYPKYAKSENKQ